MVDPVDYALAIDPAVIHVALALDGAACAALSIAELTRSYRHPVEADLARVRRHEQIDDDAAATEWIIRRAVAYLNGGLVFEGDKVAFAPGKDFDSLRWGRKKLKRPPADVSAVLRDPFNPVNGEFADNIRKELGDLTELRESMTAWGWIDRPQFRALGDRRTKIILIGHRRIAIAKELGIDWEQHIDWIKIGEGDVADAERFKLAIASNIGSKGLTPSDRKRIAAHLKVDHGWSQVAIAEALNVSQSQVQRDIGTLPIAGNVNRGLDTLGRKKSTGRPRKDKTIEDKKTPKSFEPISKLLDEGVGRKEIASTLGVAENTVQLAQQRKIGREEGQRLAQAPQPPSSPVFAEPTQCVCPNCGHVYQKIGEGA